MNIITCYIIQTTYSMDTDDTNKYPGSINIISCISPEDGLKLTFVQKIYIMQIYSHIRTYVYRQHEKIIL